MKLTDRLNELNASGQLEYNVYSELFDMASELEAKLDKCIELPCKVGDIVYVIPSKENFQLHLINHKELNKVTACKVHAIRIFKAGYLLFCCEEMVSCHSQFYKETWFLTEPEAQQRLKELEERK